MRSFLPLSACPRCRMTEIPRRRFVVDSLAGPAALAAPAAFGQTAKAANDQLTVAVIGPGGMGTAHLKLLAARKDVRIAYVCDVDANRAQAAGKVATDA